MKHDSAVQMGVWVPQSTRQAIKVLAAQRDEKMVDFVARLLTEAVKHHDSLLREDQQ